MRKHLYIKGLVLSVLIALIGFSSCGVVTQTYKSPEYNTDNLYGEKISTDTTSIANIPWREYFSDAYLIGLIEEGIANNYDLMIAYTRIEAASANLSMAKAAYLPSFALSADVNQSRTSDGSNGKNVLGYHSTSYSLGITASWEAELWGKLTSQSRSQYATLLNTYAYKNLTQTTLVSNIATYYYTLLSLDEQLKITKATVKSLEENVGTMKALKEAGDQTGAAVEQSKATLYSTLATIPDLESQIKETENAICTLLGRKSGTITRSNLYEQSYPTEMSYGIPAQMLAQRPDVQQAELSFRSYFELTNVARASFYPTISLSSASIGFGTVNTLSNFFKPENILANIIGNLTQPLFNKKQLTGNLKVAKAEQQEALLTFEETVLSAGQEVTNILNSFELSVKKNDIRTDQIEASQKSVEYTQALLVAGDVTYTEVLTAQQTLLSAQLSQVSDKLDQLKYTVSLYRALGGGVE